MLFPVRNGRPVSRFEERAAFDLRQALAALRRRAPLYVSLSERVGLPLALLLLRRRRARTPHLLVAHHLTSGRKRLLQKRLRWLDGVTGVVVPCAEQERYLREEAGVEAARVRRVPAGVDVDAWRPEPVGGSGGVLSVGRERRDYATLAAAAERLPHLAFTVVAGSPWARERGRAAPDGPVPTNARFMPGGLSHAELRRLYAEAGVVALTLEPGCRYAAGVNVLLEAMAMDRPVVATHTPGLADYLDGNPAVRSVPAGDAETLAAALCAPPPKGAASGRDALTDRGWMLEAYVAAVTRAAREAMA